MSKEKKEVKKNEKKYGWEAYSKKELKELDQMRKIIHKPCKEVLDCRLVAKRVSKLFDSDNK